MQQKKLGLIGSNISHSFSKKYFENKFQRLMIEDYSYEIYDLEDLSEVEAIFEIPNLIGVNVTIPFKESILTYLDELSDEAEKIGAVNCILIQNNIKKGFNTDVFGFEKTLSLHRKSFHKSALLLGNGGVAKAVQYVLNQYEIPYHTISRRSELNFENITKEIVAENLLIIQCTPVGTFPNIEDCLDFPFDAISEKHLVIDLIYNPNYTMFLKNSADRGAKTVNGYYMLEQQAEKNWEIWNFQKK